jgi:hypothetical protein
MWKELRWAALWALAALFITSLPYLWGLYLSSPQQQFGGFVIAVEDGNSYLAKMRQGARGEWLFRLPYTSEEHDGAFIYLFYLLLGKFAALAPSSAGTHWPPILAYHLARLLFGFLYLLTTYVSLALFTPHLAVRRLSYLLITFGSGLGWLVFLAGWVPALGAPIDFWLPEGFTFLVVYISPHIALASSLFLLALMLTITAAERGLPGRSALGGVAAAAMVVILPFYAAAIAVVLGVYFLALCYQAGRFVRRQAFILGLAALPMVPLLLYYAYVFTTNAAFATWAAQNVILSPGPLHYVLGYGFLAVLAVGGGRYLLQHSPQAQPHNLLLVGWAVTIPLLLYLPFNLQRRLIIGFQFPLCLLAALGVCRYLLPAVTRAGWLRFLEERTGRYDRRRMRRFVVTAIILLTLPSNLILLAGGMLEASHREEPIFHAGGEVQAIEWLAGRAGPADVVLSSFRTGNYIPARADVRVFLGHGPETLRSAEKRQLVEMFFRADADDSFRRRLLADYGVTYVFHGPLERALGRFDPATAPYLEQVYSAGGYAIYRVQER